MHLLIVFNVVVLTRPNISSSSAIIPRIILETDSTAIASRCSRPRPDPALNLSELKIDEQVSLKNLTSLTTQTLADARILEL